MMILSIDVNSLAKAKKIAKARNGFYEISYVLYAKKIYTVFYRVTK